MLSFLKSNVYKITVLFLLIAVSTLSVLYRNDRMFIKNLRIQMEGLSTDHRNELNKLQNDIDEYERNSKSDTNSFTALWQSIDMLLVAGGFNDKKCFDDPLLRTERNKLQYQNSIGYCVNPADIFYSQRVCGGPRGERKHAATNGCMTCEEGYSIQDHILKRLIEQDFPCTNPTPIRE